MDRLKTVGAWLILWTLIAVLLPFLLLFAACYCLWFFGWGVVLRLWFWRIHATAGRRILFVYSESPNWQEYIEVNVLPHIQDHAVVLNWSQRRHWISTSPWEARFFHHFSGTREFNPMALVFCHWGRVRPVRFYQAFLDFKHGNIVALRAAEEELFRLMEVACGPCAAVDRR